VARSEAASTAIALICAGCPEAPSRATVLRQEMRSVEERESSGPQAGCRINHPIVIMEWRAACVVYAGSAPNPRAARAAHGGAGHGRAYHTRRV
jgi:hypothetical protein